MSQIKDLVFITDVHLGGSSRVRTGSVVDDIFAKLKFVVEYCNNVNAPLLIGGDLFDKPSVPDFIKSELASLFKTCKNGVYAVAGNHCRLYDNPEFNYKTSYQVLVSSGIITDLDSTGYVDLGSVVLSSSTPIKDVGKPLVVVFHGFLNKEDGKNSLYLNDISSDIRHSTYICLGHDHVVYEPYQYTQFVKIFRPGSLLRGIREDAQLRVPELLHIKVSDTLKYKMVPIKCRDANEIFTSKEAQVDKVQKEVTYDEVIRQIREASKTDLSFEDALKQVASPEVCAYLMKVYDSAKLEESTKRQNL